MNEFMPPLQTLDEDDALKSPEKSESFDKGTLALDETINKFFTKFEK